MYHIYIHPFGLLLHQLQYQMMGQIYINYCSNLKNEIRNKIFEINQYKRLNSNLKNQFNSYKKQYNIESARKLKIENEKLLKKIFNLQNDIIDNNEIINQLRNDIEKMAIYISNPNSEVNLIINSIKNSRNENYTRQFRQIIFSHNQDRLLQEQYDNLKNNLNNNI